MVVGGVVVGGAAVDVVGETFTAGVVPRVVEVVCFGAAMDVPDALPLAVALPTTKEPAISSNDTTPKRSVLREKVSDTPSSSAMSGLLHRSRIGARLVQIVQFRDRRFPPGRHGDP